MEPDDEVDDELEEELEEEAEEARRSVGWAARRGDIPQPVFVDTGRGAPVEVTAGSPFEETIERLQEGAHYGGYFRVFLNGCELLEATDAPPTIEPGMRVAITPYDKVG